MSKTETVHTEYGAVEIETVTCDSCGHELPKEDAKQFYIGSVIQTEDWTHRNAYEVEFDSRTYKSGWVCPYCEGVGPIDYPSEKNKNHLGSGIVELVQSIFTANAEILSSIKTNLNNRPVLGVIGLFMYLTVVLIFVLMFAALVSVFV